MENSKSKLSQYEFVKDIPKNLVRVPTFLTGDFGRDFLEEYNGRVKTDYKDADLLNVLRARGGKVVGSNSFAVVLANKILRQEGLRTATPADVERILRQGDLDLGGVYVDSALVLRSADAPNEYLAKDLIKKLGNQKLPVMIPLAGLDLRVDSSAPHGLAFDVRSDTEIIYNKILNSRDGRFDSKDIDEKTGLPKELSGSERGFWTRGSGLSWFFLDGDSNLDSDGGDLGGSIGSGRVVVADAEGVAPKN